MRAQSCDLTGSLRRMGLAGAGENPVFTPLAGGVSSDIWRVDLARGPVCVKRALAKLKVAAEWQAPVERNASEVAWMETARAIVPSAAPEILGHDQAAGLFAMAFLDPARYRLWKRELLDGRVDRAAAAAVGARLGQIHAATAGDPAIARRFATDAVFHDIRLEPYLAAAGRAHPDRARPLAALQAETAATRCVLVHGDVSPKNIMLGPDGPVFLDAECAWYGDPAFDLAFCLNHLLLKRLPAPGAADALDAAFAALAAAYLARVDWEDAATLERRAARLLPGLLLARVDGKSPVEYLHEAAQKDRVRGVARALLARPVARLEAVCARWREAMS